MGYTTFKGQEVWIEPTENIDRLAASMCMSAVDDLRRFRKKYKEFKPEHDRVCKDIEFLEDRIYQISPIKYKTSEQMEQLKRLKDKQDKLIKEAKIYEKAIFPYENALSFIKSPIFAFYANIDGETALNILEEKYHGVKP